MKHSIIQFVLFVWSVDLLESTDPCTTQFGYESFITDVREDTPVGSVIGVLDVQGSESEVTLQQKSNSYLRLELPSRNITLQSQLDTDEGSGTLYFYTLCSPKSQPTTTVTVTVRVILVDVNDHPPKFSKDHYTVNVSEDTPTGTTIYKNAIATDGDFPGGGNDLFDYSILPGPYSEYFEYEYSTKADLTLKKKLDYEKTTSMQIQIMAMDGATLGNSLNSTATVTINILDSDDQNPEFTHSQYFGIVSGNSLPGTKVTIIPAQIAASDLDTLNAPVKYELLDPKRMFAINKQTGIVSVAGTLGNEPKVTVVIKAVQVDNPFRWCIATLTINITGVGPTVDKNDTLRFGSSLYDITLSESTPIGSLVKKLYPHGATNVLTYRILENQNIFEMRQSGEIILGSALDYEERHFHKITVSVSDGQTTAVTTVNVTVTDVNDNSPVIENPTIVLTSDRVQGTELTVIKVSDKDENTKFTFTLLSFANLFSVSQRGEVFITGTEEELTDEKYILTIVVRDSGVPVRESIALVTVNFPFIVKPTASARIMTESNDILAIGLGVAAAILFIVVILLIVYIIRRRLYAAEQLDKVKHQRGMNPQGLTYRPGDPSPVPSNFDLKFNGELEETSEIDGSTSIQDNPLSNSRFRYGYPNLNGDLDLDAGDEEIHIDTAVVPFEREDYFRGSGRMKTFGHDECNSSDNSYASDSTGDSNKGLMRNLKKQALSNGSEKIGNTNRLPTYMSDSVLDSRLGQKPPKEKPEITVYF